MIWGIGEDTLGRIYLSIEKEGLLRIIQMEDGSLSFKLFHLSHGLSDLNLFDIARDPAGMLWIINEGVTCFNPYDETFRVYDARNGLHGSKTWGDNLYIDGEGNLFISAAGGYETCRINNLQVIPGITYLHFEPIEINGSLLQKGIRAAFSKAVRLEAGQRNLVFHYKAICFQDPDQVKYAYKLDGYDADWILAGNNPEARYTNLQPGKY